MGAVLYTVAETVRRLAILSQPVMPDSMGSMLDQLGVPEDARGFTALAAPLAPGTRFPKPQGLFPRYAEPNEGTN
jgi:methionyl-tRNA synthetase